MEKKKSVVIIISLVFFLLLFVYWFFFPQDRMLIYVLFFFYCFILFFTLFIGCSVRFSGGFLSDRINGMMYPKRYLREKPVMLARIVGLIQQHDYAAAEQELLKIVLEKPLLQDAVAMLGQLYLDNIHNYGMAEKITAEYLCRRGKVSPGDLNVVNLYVDACLEQGKKAEALARLDYELKRHGYDNSDRKALAVRRGSLG